MSKATIATILLVTTLLLGGLDSGCAQSLSPYFGLGTATDSGCTSVPIPFSPCEPLPTIGGMFGIFGADLMILKHLGVNGEYAFRFAQAPYLPLVGVNFRPAFYDFNVVWRARKHSTLSAVVLRFSRARKRYERQGVLVEEAALEHAEQDCLADADKRAAQRERAEVYRYKQDQALATRMAESIRQMFPGCPPGEARIIAVHTSVRGSGRVGRTAPGRALDEEALHAAVIAAIRHRHTDYDRLLMKGWDRMDARNAVRGDVNRVLDEWRKA